MGASTCAVGVQNLKLKAANAAEIRMLEAVAENGNGLMVVEYVAQNPHDGPEVVPVLTAQATREPRVSMQTVGACLACRDNMHTRHGRNTETMTTPSHHSILKRVTIKTTVPKNETVFLTPTVVSTNVQPSSLFSVLAYQS